jgi:hypothetical protein
MLAQAIPFVIACLFAFLLGFAAHRASICTVRAVGGDKRPHRLHAGEHR